MGSRVSTFSPELREISLILSFLDMIQLSVLRPSDRCHSNSNRALRGFLFRHPQCRWPPLRPFHHRYRRPGGVPGAMVCHDIELGRLPPCLRYHQPLES